MFRAVTVKLALFNVLTEPEACLFSDYNTFVIQCHKQSHFKAIIDLTIKTVTECCHLFEIL